MRWIFGYGSLVWRPGFDAVDARVARLDGFARRFWQGSPDHRGVPEAPGRVVTLVRDPHAHTIGMAYRVSDPVWNQVVENLDVREQGGYVRTDIEVTLLHGGSGVTAVTYVGEPGNPHWLGPAPIEAMVEHIRHAVGPSGRNDDYVLRLDAWLREVGAEDAHVRELAVRLQGAGVGLGTPRHERAK